MRVRGHRWRGANLSIRVLYSAAGIATQILVSSRSTNLLVDAADGTLRDLQGILDARLLNAILLTHGHFDHIGGLWSLLGFMRMVGRRSTLRIFIPKDCAEPRELITTFLNVHKQTLPFRINILRCLNHRPRQVGDIAICPFNVRHRGRIAMFGDLPEVPAVGYRLICRGDQVVFSGDTGECENLLQEVKGVDLAVLEATRKSDGPSDSHLTVAQARQIGKTAKEYLLIHRH